MLMHACGSTLRSKWLEERPFLKTIRENTNIYLIHNYNIHKYSKTRLKRAQLAGAQREL